MVCRDVRERRRLEREADLARRRAEEKRAELSVIFSAAPVAITVLRGPYHVIGTGQRQGVPGLGTYRSSGGGLAAARSAPEGGRPGSRGAPGGRAPDGQPLRRDQGADPVRATNRGRARGRLLHLRLPAHEGCMGKGGIRFSSSLPRSRRAWTRGADRGAGFLGARARGSGCGSPGRSADPVPGEVDLETQQIEAHAIVRDLFGLGPT